MGAPCIEVVTVMRADTWGPRFHTLTAIGTDHEHSHAHSTQVMLERARLAASAKAPTAAAAPSSDPLMAKYKQYKRQAAVVAMAGEL